MLKLIAHFVVTSAEQAVDRWLRVPENWISHQFSNQFLTSQQSFPVLATNFTLCRFFETSTWNKEQMFGFCVSCLVLQQWLFCYEIEGEGDTSGLPPPYAYNKQQQSCNWLPNPLPELISPSCEDNPTSIENNSHWAKLWQETLLERSFLRCSIVWVIVTNLIDLITDITIKAFMESIVVRRLWWLMISSWSSKPLWKASSWEGAVVGVVTLREPSLAHWERTHLPSQ